MHTQTLKQKCAATNIMPSHTVDQQVSSICFSFSTIPEFGCVHMFNAPAEFIQVQLFATVFTILSLFRRYKKIKGQLYKLTHNTKAGGNTKKKKK